ncbi:MAG: methionine adenosyltransferase [Patescibacteria group bacterium]
MMYKSKVYTVESVTAGHPDKVCDQISDAILDKCIEQDPKTRAGIEAFGSHNLIVVGGEITTLAEFDPIEIANKVYRDIGYDEKETKVIAQIARQSPDIAQGVDTGGAGDQGIMYGYACDETDELLPKGIVLVHKLTKGLEKLRREVKTPWLGPDGKAQVTVEGDKVKNILVSCQHSENIAQEEIKDFITRELISSLISEIGEIEILVNPTGKFTLGGFSADAGLTGRKIMVDTYGGLIPHGGGCFSGKDPSKVDRSAAYMARFVAKNLVANNLAKECLVSVAYAIGRAEPLMIEATDEEGKSLVRLVKEKFDFRPRAIIERLNLLKPIYSQTAAYGHFGKAGLPWEEVISL